MKLLNFGLLIGLLFSVSTFADQNFKKKHPRRAEVLNRANNEEHKNDSAKADGKITDKQARRLNRQDRRIKREEQAQAKANGGFITKKQKARDNRQENRVNHERNEMEKHDAANGAASPTSPVPAQ